MTRILLLPGLHGTGALFDEFIRMAPAQLQVEVVPLPPGSLGYSGLVQHFAERLTIDSETILLAESFSGPLAIGLAARKPPGCVVLVNTFVLPPRSPLLRAAVPLVSRLTPSARMVRHFLVGPTGSDALVTRVREVLRSVPHQVRAARLAAVLRVDATDEVHRCSSPFLYLRGTEDRLVPEASVNSLRAARPGRLEVEYIPGPHLLLQVAPEQSWVAINRYITRVPAT